MNNNPVGNGVAKPVAKLAPGAAAQPKGRKWRAFRGFLAWIGGVILTLLLAFLTINFLVDPGDPRPFRTVWTANGHKCPPQNLNATPASMRDEASNGCGNQIWERRDDYDLFFAEFTDQGLQYPEGLNDVGSAPYQIDRTLDGLKEIDAVQSGKGISLIVFVHGWRHNASYDNGNVISFRNLLAAAAHAERETGRRVVGVYVGWRGLSTSFSSLELLTFWGRKEAAARVAQGSTRELFNRLRNFRCERNRTQLHDGRTPPGFDDCSWVPTPARPQARVNTVMVGHSFGAWILYNSLAGALLETVAHHHSIDQSGPANLRYADLVVLLNPAFEASRFTPLHRIASRPSASTSYQTPMLVSVTSETDFATHTAFGWGRRVNWLMEETVGNEEAKTFFSTPGHTDSYITHLLRFEGYERGTCEGWTNLGRFFERVNNERGSEEARHELNAAAETNLQAEVAHAKQFIRNFAATENRGVRDFCSGLRLKTQQLNHGLPAVPNSVVWNVRAEPNVMDGHNDHSSVHLLDFIRELYLEVSRIPPVCRTSRRSPQEQTDDPVCR
ncbi:hypothetical protein JMJ55_25200 [Belnapia sp. T6]|uniref:Uncharacterized protein n=1 Tax=Belnapia mucosa TaxID=2804532 RepID=A0ABS1VAF1_9PROT|nr:hypothetical protein [Belnapia mucosa]MBL6458640.1 hypothetical protein [Belnapia mucosa]